jgi:hypothetical protein
MPRRAGLHRILWFIALWLGGVGAVGLLALVIRTVLMAG